MIHLLPPVLTREAQLVVLCARTGVDPSTSARIRQVAQGSVNWGCVAELAKWHGVVPLVYRNLARHCREWVLPIVLEDLRQYYHAGALLSQSLAKELAGLCRAFSDKGLDVVPFKGLSVAACAYGDVAARECGDLDLIVRQADVPRAHELLLSEGYEYAMDAVHHGGDSSEPFHLFIKRHKAATVDLQWVMADRTFSFRLDQPQFWARLTRATIGGGEVKVLSPEDLLVVLCVHGSKHVWEQLKWVCDVAELVRAHPMLDWVYVRRAARSLRCWRLVLMGLALARALFGVSLPEAIHRAIVQDAQVPALARRMPQTLLATQSYGIGEASCEAFFFSTKDTWWEQWRYGVALCLARSEALTTDYPWQPAWYRLQGVSTIIHPAQRLMRWVVPSAAARRRAARWMMLAE